MNTRHARTTARGAAAAAAVALLACAGYGQEAATRPAQPPTVPGAARPEETGPASALAPGLDANYKIGVGDVLEVRVLGHENMSGVTRVSNAGTIRVPFVEEDIQALCATERELAMVVEDKLRKYLRHPEVHVAVKDFVGNPVYVTGAVGAPQQLKTMRSLRLIEALILTGGINSQKAGSVAFIIHSGNVASCSESAATSGEPTSEMVNLARLRKGDMSEDRVLQAGDIVIVSEADQVFIAGEVLKPNAYQLADGLTLTKLLALAGGPTGIAKTDAVRIVRQEPGKPRAELLVNLKEVQKNKAEDPTLLANDVIEVPSSTGKKIWNGFMQTIGGAAGQLPVRVVP